MRLELHGANVTTAMIEVLDSLQNEPGRAATYLDALDIINSYYALRLADPDTGDEQARRATLWVIGQIQKLAADVRTLAYPPDVDDVENDIPAVQL